MAASAKNPGQLDDVADEFEVIALHGNSCGLFIAISYKKGAEETNPQLLV
ncbi:MAG: hypothetical protein JXA41_11560 [Deltaproteobacteria bacterium]|nr:hypothetical protein [Deltaproteobacteria bacterium]